MSAKGSTGFWIPTASSTTQIEEIGYTPASGFQDIVARSIGLGGVAGGNKTLALYNAFTSSTNFERLNLDWSTTANVCQVYNSVGTAGGTPRQLVVGGWTQVTDAAGQQLLVRGDSAYAQSTVNTTGTSIVCTGGIGRRFFTIITASNLSGKTFTFTVNGLNTVLTDGVSFTHSGVNATEASNLAGASVTGVSMMAVGAVVYVTPNANTYSLQITTNAAVGDATATQGADGATIMQPGTAASPTLQTSLSASTGFFFPSANGVGISGGGTYIIGFSANQVAINSAATVQWTSGLPSVTPDTQLGRQNSAGVLGLFQNTSGASAALRIYNTTDNATTPSNSEFVETVWSGNACTIRTNATGTGVTRSLSIAPATQLASGVGAAVNMTGGTAVGGANAGGAASVNGGQGSGNALAGSLTLFGSTGSSSVGAFTLKGGTWASTNTDVNGGTACKIIPGIGTGAGKPGDLQFQTGFTLATGTTAHPLGDRFYLAGNSVTMSTTTATPTTILVLNLPTSGSGGGCMIIYHVVATDGSNYNTATGSLTVSCSNKAGTVTATTAVITDESSNVNSGTLSAGAVTTTVASQAVSIKIAPTFTVIVPTSVICNVTAIPFGNTVTVTAQ